MSTWMPRPPVHQVHRARPGGGEANAEPSGMLRERRCHEGCGLLVAPAHEGDAVLPLAQGLDDRIDPVADDAEHVRGAPADQRLDEDVGGVPVRRRRGRGLGDEVAVGFALRGGRRRRPGSDARDPGHHDEVASVEALRGSIIGIGVHFVFFRQARDLVSALTLVRAADGETDP